MNLSTVQYTPPVNDGLDILYQDNAMLVLNKPSGLLSVPGRGEHKQDSLAYRVQIDYPDASIVHRLDMETSGIMVMARGKDMQRAFSRLFEHRQVSKQYIAIVDGKPEQDSGVIELPLIADWPNRPLQMVDHENGKPATTYYRVIKFDKNKKTSRVELAPITGRSHQLRVHMQALGHAILGDTLYANDGISNKATRLLLHAESLSLQHPVTMENMTFHCEAPF